MKRLNIAVLSLLLISFQAFAQKGPAKTSLPSQSVEVKKGNRLIVKGFYGQLKLRTLTKGNSLRVTGRRTLPKTQQEDQDPSMWTFQISKSENVIIVEVRTPTDRSFWQGLNKSLTAGATPKVDLLISAPSLPTEITWKKGRIDIQAWQGPLNISLHDGQINSLSMVGDLTVQLTKGLLKTSKHEGRLSVDSYGADVELVSSKGALDISNFTGKSLITKHEGNLDLKSFSGATEITGFEGVANFDIKRGKLTAKKLDGRVRGKTDTGRVDLQLVGDEINANVTSGAGSIVLRPPKNSRANVRLKTQDGQLAGPRSLKFQSLVTGKFLVGNLKGSKPGRIRLSSESGNISVR